MENGQCNAIQLTMQTTFISSLDTGEFHTMHSKSDNAEIMSGIETNDVINELFKSFLKRYHGKLETRMEEGSNSVYKNID